MRKKIQELLGEWCWLTFTDGVFRVTTFVHDDPIVEVMVENFVRDNYPTDKRLRFLTTSDIPEGMEYMLPSGRYTPRYNPDHDTGCVTWRDAMLDAKSRIRYGRKGAFRDPIILIECGFYALSIWCSRRNYKILSDAIRRRTGSFTSTKK